MVSRAERRSLRFASCCRVLVVKGATGLRTVGFASTAATCQRPAMAACCRARASASANNFTLLPTLIAPVLSSKSEPFATRSPPKWVNLASKGICPWARLALRSQ